MTSVLLTAEDKNQEMDVMIRLYKVWKDNSYLSISKLLDNVGNTSGLDNSEWIEMIENYYRSEVGNENKEI